MTNKGITKPVDVVLPLRTILVWIDAIGLKYPAHKLIGGYCSAYGQEVCNI